MVFPSRFLLWKIVMVSEAEPREMPTGNGMRQMAGFCVTANIYKSSGANGASGGLDSRTVNSAVSAASAKVVLYFLYLSICQQSSWIQTNCEGKLGEQGNFIPAR